MRADRDEWLDADSARLAAWGVHQLHRSWRQDAHPKMTVSDMAFDQAMDRLYFTSGSELYVVDAATAPPPPPSPSEAVRAETVELPSEYSVCARSGVSPRVYLFAVGLAKGRTDPQDPPVQPTTLPLTLPLVLPLTPQFVTCEPRGPACGRLIIGNGHFRVVALQPA
jgi:hypothetical protein